MEFESTPSAASQHPESAPTPLPPLPDRTFIDTLIARGWDAESAVALDVVARERRVVEPLRALLVESSGGPQLSFIRALQSDHAEWRFEILPFLTHPTAAHCRGQLIELGERFSTALNGGGVTVGELVRVGVAVIDSGAKYQLQPESFAAAALICAASKHRRNDLSFLEQASRNQLKYSVEDIRQYYAEGHRYICDPAAVVPQLAEALNPQGKVMLSVLRSFARSEAPPDMKFQLELGKRIASLPADLRTPAIELALHLSKPEEGRRLLLEMFAVMAHRPPPTGVALVLLAAFHEMPLTEALNGALLMRDILRTDPAALDTYVERLLGREFSSVAGEIHRRKLNEDRFVEKPLEELRRDFSTPEHEYSELPSTATVQRLIGQYQELLKLELQLEKLSDQALTALCRKIPQRVMVAAGEGAVPDTTRLEVLGIAREVFRREFGARPYNTQMLALLLLTDPKELVADRGPLRGLYAQIRTGEGKSLMLAVLAAYHALTGRWVDVITSDPLLVRRDALKFSDFFERMGLESGHYHYDPSAPAAERNIPIIYTTNDSLIFGRLAAQLEGGRFFQGKRSDLALIDEADNLCLDMMKEACRISTKIEPIIPRELMQKMLMMVQRGGRALTAKEVVSEYPPAAALPRELIELYLGSAQQSLALRRDVDYVVRDGKVQIVDKLNTGRVQARSQWGAGLHDFVALREGAEPAKVRGLACQMAHPDLLLSYRNIFCISGTFGDRVDREELQQIYGLKGYDIPRHRPNLRVDEPLRLFRSDEERNAALVTRAEELVRSGRALLTVSHTIEQSRRLNQALKARGLPAALLNDVDNRTASGEEGSEYEIIESAGEHGAIVNGTGVTARGADIVVTPSCAAAGGLEVIGTDVPTNRRTEQQIRGRAARQGDPGSSRIWVCTTDEWFQTLPADQREVLTILVSRPEFGPEHPMTAATLELYKVYGNVLNAARRRVNHQYQQLLKGPQEHFFRACAQFTAALEVKYPDLREPEDGPRLGNPALERVRRLWGARNELFKITIDAAQARSSARVSRSDAPSEFFKRIEREFERLYGFPISQISQGPEAERSFRACLRSQLADMATELRRAEAEIAETGDPALRQAAQDLCVAVDGWFEELRVEYLLGNKPPPKRRPRGAAERKEATKPGQKPLLTEEMEDAIDNWERRQSGKGRNGGKGARSDRQNQVGTD